jgi:hypothetical protein
LKAVPASVDNTVVGTTAAYTDGNVVPAAAGSTPLAVTLFKFYTGHSDIIKWLKKSNLLDTCETTTVKIAIPCTSGTKR